MYTVVEQQKIFSHQLQEGCNYYSTLFCHQTNGVQAKNLQYSQQHATSLRRISQECHSPYNNWQTSVNLPNGKVHPHTTEYTTQCHNQFPTMPSKHIMCATPCTTGRNNASSLHSYYNEANFRQLQADQNNLRFQRTPPRDESLQYFNTQTRMNLNQTASRPLSHYANPGYLTPSPSPDHLCYSPATPANALQRVTFSGPSRPVVANSQHSQTFGCITNSIPTHHQPSPNTFLPPEQQHIYVMPHQANQAEHRLPLPRKHVLPARIDNIYSTTKAAKTVQSMPYVENAAGLPVLRNSCFEPTQSATRYSVKIVEDKLNRVLQMPFIQQNLHDKTNDYNLTNQKRDIVPLAVQLQPSADRTTDYNLTNQKRNIVPLAVQLQPSADRTTDYNSSNQKRNIIPEAVQLQQSADVSNELFSNATSLQSAMQTECREQDLIPVQQAKANITYNASNQLNTSHQASSLATVEDEEDFVQIVSCFSLSTKHENENMKTINMDSNQHFEPVKSEPIEKWVESSLSPSKNNKKCKTKKKRRSTISNDKEYSVSIKKKSLQCKTNHHKDNKSRNLNKKNKHRSLTIIYNQCKVVGNIKRLEEKYENLTHKLDEVVLRKEKVISKDFVSAKVTKVDTKPLVSNCEKIVRSSALTIVQPHTSLLTTRTKENLLRKESDFINTTPKKRARMTFSAPPKSLRMDLLYMTNLNRLRKEGQAIQVDDQERRSNKFKKFSSSRLRGISKSQKTIMKNITQTFTQKMVSPQVKPCYVHLTDLKLELF